MISKSNWETDWRNIGQLDYLKNKELLYVKFTKKTPEWDHEHCAFCWDKISQIENSEHYAYCTKNKKYWICKSCFNELKEIFNWKITE